MNVIYYYYYADRLNMYKVVLPDFLILTTHYENINLRRINLLELNSDICGISIHESDVQATSRLT